MVSWQSQGDQGGERHGEGPGAPLRPLMPWPSTIAVTYSRQMYGVMAGHGSARLQLTATGMLQVQGWGAGGVGRTRGLGSPKRMLETVRRGGCCATTTPCVPVDKRCRCDLCTARARAPGAMRTPGAVQVLWVAKGGTWESHRPL